MEQTMRLRSVYSSKKKRIMISSGATYKKYDYMWFYLLPTIEFDYNEIYEVFEDDYDYCIDINFKWLLWYFTISVDWNNKR